MTRKTILITGCGPGGIGAALAKDFQLRGHQVFASGLSEDHIDPSLSADYGIQTLVLDVTSQPSIDQAVQTVRDNFQSTSCSSPAGKSEQEEHGAYESNQNKLLPGSLDMLINNAGVIDVMPFADTQLQDVRALYDVNVFGVWAVTQAFLPLLVAARPGGLVVDIGSIDPVVCPPFFAAYSSSKAAAEAVNRTIRRELAPLGVRVVNVKSGSVRTPLFANCAPRPLPGGSWYRAIRAWIEDREFLAFSLSRQSEVDDYGRRLVDDLLKDAPKPVIWIGGMSTMTWIYSLIGWETMMVCVLICLKCIRF